MPGGRPNIPRGLSTPAKQARRDFLAAYEKYSNEAKSIALTILVWGPSPHADTPVARKRLAIRQHLQDMGHYAVFPEDLPTFDRNASAKTKEYAQARAANLIIVLIEGAPGATAEVHDFGNDLDIFPKLQVMVPTKYR